MDYLIIRRDEFVGRVSLTPCRRAGASRSYCQTMPWPVQRPMPCRAAETSLTDEQRRQAVSALAQTMEQRWNQRQRHLADTLTPTDACPPHPRDSPPLATRSHHAMSDANERPSGQMICGHVQVQPR